jgi:hypothetical protein
VNVAPNLVTLYSKVVHSATIGNWKCTIRPNKSSAEFWCILCLLTARDLRELNEVHSGGVETYRRRWNMSCIRPTARILFLICCRLAAASPGDVASIMMARSASSSDDEESSSSSSREHTDRIACSILITVDHINESTLWSNGSPALLSNERKTPGKCVHEIREPEWVWACMILAYFNSLVRVLEHSTPVVMHIEVIGCREHCDQRRAFLSRDVTKYVIAAMHSDHETDLGAYTYPQS